MDRAFFSHESLDPDIVWLLQTFKERRPEYRLIENSGGPLILFLMDSHVKECPKTKEASPKDSLLASPPSTPIKPKAPPQCEG